MTPDKLLHYEERALREEEKMTRRFAARIREVQSQNAPNFNETNSCGNILPPKATLINAARKSKGGARR